jgi:hypothetical protein
MAKHPTVMSTLLELQAKHPNGMRFLCNKLPNTAMGYFIAEEIKIRLTGQTFEVVVWNRSKAWKKWLFACGGEGYVSRRHELRRRWLAAIIARKPTKKTLSAVLLLATEQIINEGPKS